MKIEQKYCSKQASASYGCATHGHAHTGFLKDNLHHLSDDGLRQWETLLQRELEGFQQYWGKRTWRATRVAAYEAAKEDQAALKLVQNELKRRYEVKLRQTESRCEHLAAALKECQKA